MKLQELREGKSLSIEGLSEMARVPVRTITAVEAGESRPSEITGNSWPRPWRSARTRLTRSWRLCMGPGKPMMSIPSTTNGRNIVADDALPIHAPCCLFKD